MTNSWTQIFKAHHFFLTTGITYTHVNKTAWDYRQSLTHVSMPITCVDVVAQITNKYIVDEGTFDISNLKGLKFLFLEEQDLDTLAPIEPLKDVEIINCWRNEIDSLVPIKEFFNLKELHFSGNKVSNLQPLCGLTQLTTVDLTDNQVTSIPDFSKLTNLKSLDLNYNQIRDISPLSQCKSLETLSLYGVPVSNTKIVDLKRQLPKCTIQTIYKPDGFEEDLFGHLTIKNDKVFFTHFHENYGEQTYHIVVSLFDTDNNSSNGSLTPTLKEIAENSLFKYLHSNGRAAEIKRQHYFEETDKLIRVQFDLI